VTASAADVQENQQPWRSIVVTATVVAAVAFVMVWRPGCPAAYS
jgi:hypothetical protein